MWLEQNPESTLFEFLNYFGMQFREAKENVMVKSPQGNEGVDFSKVAESIKNAIEEQNKKKEEMVISPPIIEAHNLEGQDNKEEEVTQIPDDQDWEEIIIPAARNHLYNTGKRNYEVEEWIRIVQAHRNNSDTLRALNSVQYNIFEGVELPEAIRRFFPRGNNYWRKVNIE